MVSIKLVEPLFRFEGYVGGGKRGWFVECLLISWRKFLCGSGYGPSDKQINRAEPPEKDEGLVMDTLTAKPTKMSFLVTQTSRWTSRWTFFFFCVFF